MRLSKKIQTLQPSATLALNQKARAMKEAGKSIINLTTGEPDLITPERIRKAAIRAIDRGETKYTPTSGIAELKKAIVRKMDAEYGRKYALNQVIVSVGAKQSLFNVCLAILDPGDEAIVLAPYWTSYTEIVSFAGGKPVVVDCEERNGFCPEIGLIQKAVTNKTRAIFLNSPNNPTGAVLPRSLLCELAKFVANHPEICVVTDDIYERFLFGGRKFESIGMESALSPEQLVIVNGVSKTYAMTGWRIGYAVGPKHLIESMDALQSQSTSNPSSIAQWAAVEAMEGDQSDVAAMCRTFEDRRNRLLNWLKEIPGLSCQKPEGAFYVFPNLSAFVGKKTPKGATLGNDLDLAAYLLEESGVATVPGSVFGAEGFLRITYSAALADLEEGARRLARGLKELR